MLLSLCYTSLLVPISSTSLVLSALQPYYEVGSSVTLTCSVTEPNPSHHVDIDTTVNIQWSSYKKTSNNYSIYSYNENYNHTFTKLKLSDAGKYNCSYYLTSTADNFYVRQSDVKTKGINVTVKSKLGLNY